ncbi:MAG: hypothetical protein ABSD08_13305, partial [Xanthobacteraceae bacterium]
MYDVVPRRGFLGSGQELRKPISQLPPALNSQPTKQFAAGAGAQSRRKHLRCGNRSECEPVLARQGLVGVTRFLIGARTAYDDLQPAMGQDRRLAQGSRVPRQRRPCDDRNINRAFAQGGFSHSFPYTQQMPRYLAGPGCWPEA